MTAREPVPFTGERLHDSSDLFAVDLARHRAAYRFAEQRVGSGRVLDLGCGSGYGSHELTEEGVHAVGIDRVLPDPEHRGRGVHFLRGDLRSLALQKGAFDLLVSFQVIEHLEDARPYLHGIENMLRPGGVALITTPNRLMSDGENPSHVREYIAEELAAELEPHFKHVEMLGIGAVEPVGRYYEARLESIRRITRLDPLGLRRRLPRPLVEWMCARLAIVVRKLMRSEGKLPDPTWRDFPVGPVDRSCLDLLALCTARGSTGPDLGAEGRGGRGPDASEQAGIA